MRQPTLDYSLCSVTITLLFCMVLIFCALPAQAGHTISPKWDKLIERLEQDGFDKDEIRTHFSNLKHDYSSAPMGKKMRTLFVRKFIRPHAPKPQKASSGSPAIYPGVLVQSNLTRARRFISRHKQSLVHMEDDFGVPAEIAVGLMLVETRLGAYLGNAKALHNLACLAATTETKQIAAQMKGLKINKTRRNWLKKRLKSKSDWAYAELKALLTYTHENGMDPVEMPGSIYGAVGICQFMPSNILRFGVDGNGDGRVNLFHVPDAIHSLANYLHVHGWKRDMSHQQKQKVLYRYNHSNMYANTILAIADALQ